MSPERWQEAQRIFEKGLELSASEREVLLLHECAKDPDLAAQVQTLWAHSESAGTFLENPVFTLPSDSPNLTESVHDLAAGALLGRRFTVLELLGRGGMAEVYRARDERLGRVVAIKILPGWLLHRQPYHELLEQEAQATSALNHPRICTLHGVGTHGGSLYLVMEYLPGETLAKRMERGKLPFQEILAIAAQICDGLSYLHAQGFVHRDLKPANIMLAPQGVKLLDFGISKYTAWSGPEELRVQALDTNLYIAGSPGYTSPEQARGGPVDARSDIFSLGCVLYEMTTGCAPFGGGSVLATLEAVTQSDPKPIQSLRAHVPPPLERIVTRCLQKHAEDRFPDIGEVNRALGSFEGRGRNRTAQAAATVGLAAMVAGQIYFVSRSNVPESMEPSVAPFTSYVGIEYHPSISADGKRVAFLWNGEKQDRFHVYEKPIGPEPPRRLTSSLDSEEHWTSWSPDERFIAFERGGKAFVISPSDKHEKELGKMGWKPGLGCDPYLAWTPDSRHLIFTEQNSSLAPALVMQDIATGEICRITTPPQDSGGDWCPMASPDGRRLLWARAKRAGPPSYFQADFGNGPSLKNPYELTWVHGMCPAWTADGRELLYSANLKTGLAMMRISTERPSAPKRLPFGDEGMYPAVARTGNRLVYMHRKIDVDIWQAGNPLMGGEPGEHKHIFSTRRDEAAQYSPDGRQISFVTQRSGTPELWTTLSDGSAPRKLAECDASSLPRWFPDGSRIIYDYKGDLFTIDVKSGAPQRIPSSLGQKHTPAYSRDGRWIYFSSDISGQSQVFRIPADGGEERN